jgi:periplasmic protein TonB
VNLRQFSTLQIALGVSFAVHAALLTVRFVAPETFNRLFEEAPLEVILVNARTNERPDKAVAIAQASLAGGGDADSGRATSPLPSSLLNDHGDALEEETQKKLLRLQQQQTLLLAQVRKQLAAMPVPDPNQPSDTPEKQAQEEKRRQFLKALAEIERNINTQNARPKKRYISPATREAVYAVYYDRLRRSIEAKGTDNFPEAGGKKLYGELTMVLTVNFDGRIVSSEIVTSSGDRTLDRRAEAIARSAAPFGNFTADMRREADQIVVVSRFRFTRDETLETQVSAKQPPR